MSRKVSCYLACSLFGAVSAAAQTPASVPGLQLWLDAQDPATVITSGGFVTQWNSKAPVAGVAARQPTAGLQPTQAAAGINGRPSIRLDSTSGMAISNAADNFGIGTGGVSGNWDIFIVDQYWGALNGRTLQSRDTNWLVGKWGGPAGGMPAGTAFNALYAGNWTAGGTGGTPAVANVPAITEGFGNRGGEFAMLQGNKVFGWQTGGVAPGKLGLGAGGLFPAEGSQSDVGEVLAFNRQLTDTERRGVVNYLANQWGMGKQFQGRYATQSTLFTGADAGEGLDFSGNFIAAVRVGVGVTAGQTIGNATFTNDIAGGANPVTITAENNIAVWGAPNYGGGAADTALAQVMGSIRWSNSANGGVDTVSGSVGNLIVGNTYKTQFLFNEACCGDTRGFTLVVNGREEYQNFSLGAHMVPGSEAAGVALVHQFVATNSTMTFELKAPAKAGDRNPTLNAYTVENRGITGVSSKGTIAAANAGPGHGADLVGNFLYALDIGGNVTATVGSASFVPAGTVTNATVFAENVLDYNRPEIGAAPSDDAFESVLHSIRWDGTLGDSTAPGVNNGFKFGRNDGVSVDLEGLTAGQAYKLQLLFSDGNALNRGFDIVINDVLAERNFSVGSVTGGDSTMGAWWAWEFTADSGNLGILLNGVYATGFTDRNPVLSGLTLEIVPEPSSAALLALGACGLLRRRRK